MSLNNWLEDFRVRLLSSKAIGRRRRTGIDQTTRIAAPGRASTEALEERRLLTAIEPDVLDVVAGAGAIDPQQITNVNGVLFFSAESEEAGRELCSSYVAVQSAFA